MSLTVLSANTKYRAVPIVADRADFVPVTSSLHDVNEFVKIVRIL